MWTGSCIFLHLICSGSKCWFGTAVLLKWLVLSLESAIASDPSYSPYTFSPKATQPKPFYLVKRSKNVLLNHQLIIHSKEPFCPLTHCTFLSLSLFLFPTVSETHLKIKDIHIQDLLRARNIYFICPSAKIKMKQERSIHLNTNELAELQIFTF